jgi:tRNA(Ile)-lysidine synthase
MSPLVRRVRRTIRQRALFAEGDRVAVALSGGPDSVALTWLLGDLAPRASWKLVGLVHVNHGLRDRESDADETFCRALAARLGLPITVIAVDVRSRAAMRRQSIEAAARVERYAAFERAAVELGATRIATGHTIDDQAETVLLRLFRGAGARGLSAIRPRRGLYARPLIDVRRAELLGDLVRRGEAARDDSSNLDRAVPRNRLRHDVLPLVSSAWPGAVPALARFAELAADDERFLAETARRVGLAVAIPSAAGVQQIDVRGLNQLPAALARRIVRQGLEAAGGRAWFRDIEAVRALARADKPDGHLDLDGATIERDGPRLRFSAGVSAEPPAAFEYVLGVPGAVAVPETGMTIRASLIEGAAGRPRAGEPVSVAVLDAAALALPLSVRSRRRGDRMRPLGSAGSRKLQDLFVDRKVPRAERDRVPLVVDAEGRIVWVVGYAIAEACRVTTPESGVVILEMKKGRS